MLEELNTFCRQRRSIFYPKADLPLAGGERKPPAEVPDSLEIQGQVAELCQQALGKKVLSVSPLGEQGTFHWLYRVRLATGRPVIVRLNARSHEQRDFPLQIDPWVMRALRREGLPALHVYRVDLSRRSCPYDYEILEEAPGQPLKAYDGDENALRPLLGELGRILARLHGIRTEGFGLLDVRPLVLGEKVPRGIWGALGSWQEYVLLRLEDHVQACQAAGAIQPDEARRIRAVFERAEVLLADVRPALLHGDLGSHNVFTDGRTITALIDWEDCLSGDPVFDVAFWATFHPEERHPAFLAGYRSARALPADFEPRFWLYFLRIALAKTVLRHRLGISDRPGRAPAARRIQKALEHVEGLAPRSAAA